MKFRLRPIFKDISLTFIAEAILLLSFFFIYRLIAKNYGPEGLGEYSLVKKVAGFFHSLLFLGMGVGIPRYIAISQDEDKKNTYIRTGGMIIIIFTFIFLIIINLFKEYFTKIFFGTSDYIILVLPFSFFLSSLILHRLVYSYYRGHLLVKTLNTFQIINLGLVPIIILVFFKNITIGMLISLIGVTTFIIAFIFSLPFIKEFYISIEKGQFKNSLKELLYYSLPRVPGDFALAGLLSLGVIFAAHSASIQEVGYLSVSQSLLNTTGTAIAPLGLILLPKVSSLIAQKREAEIRENLNFLIGTVIQCSVFVCFQLIIFTDAIIGYWLGSEFIKATPTMQIVFCSIIFNVFYVAMRSILDAVEIRPLNAINIFVSLSVFLLLAGLLFLFKSFASITILSIAFTSGMACLGILTYISIRKIYPGNLKGDLNYLWIAIIINIFLGGIAILVKSFVILKFRYLIFFIVLLGIIYLSILWLLKMEWIREIAKNIGIRES